VLATERNHDIGKRLYELRFEQALTQEELAQRAGVHAVTISDIERGDRKASAKTTRKLAAGLGVEVSDLNGS
jgi:transcriptional regulator with XRE-family HTH domain